MARKAKGISSKKIAAAESAHASVTPISTATASCPNIAVEWKVARNGSAELVVAYEGPLATRAAVVARAGTWRRGGGRWSEERDVSLERQGSRWVGSIPFREGSGVEAVELAFRAGEEWDNGGLAPLGYYEWSQRERRIDVRA